MESVKLLLDVRVDVVDMVSTLHASEEGPLGTEPPNYT